MIRRSWHPMFYQPNLSHWLSKKEAQKALKAKHPDMVPLGLLQVVCDTTVPSAEVKFHPLKKKAKK